MTESPTRQCPSCAETIKREAQTCPHCGYQLVNRSAVSFLAIYFVFALLMYGIFGDNAGFVIVGAFVVIVAYLLVKRQRALREQ